MYVLYIVHIYTYAYTFVSTGSVFALLHPHRSDFYSVHISFQTGCSDAFAAYEVGIPFSFTIQLADNGVHGYLLPSASIEPTARDAFEIITAMIDYI